MAPPVPVSRRTSEISRLAAVELAVAGAALALVAILALGIRLDLGLGRVDLALVRLVQDGGTTAVTDVMRIVSDVAGTDGLMLVVAAVALGLVARRHWHGAAALVLSVLATQAACAVLKPLIERDRPPAGDALVDAGGYSFPSAHSASSVAVYGILALIAAHELRGRGGRPWVIAAGLLVCAGVGLSRVYLGAHYPSDVLAGWIVGAIIAVASWRAALAVRGLQGRPATT